MAPRLTPGARAFARTLAHAVGPAAAFALLATAIARTHGVPFGIDVAFHAWSVDHRSASGAALARLITRSAGGVLPYVAALYSGWAGCRPAARTRRKVLTAVVALLALAGGEWVRGIVMAALARPRPPLADWAGPASGYAFPSGHSMTSTLAAGLLVWAARWERLPRLARVVAVFGVGWAVAVGASRIYLGMHWPTDVIGGWLLAAAWLTLVVPPIAAVADRWVPRN